MRRMRRVLMAAAIVTVLVVLDEASKELAIHTLKGHPPIYFPRSWAPNDLFRFQFATNNGAFLSLFSNLSDSLRSWILVGLNSVILIAVSGILVGKRTLGAGISVALACILSGGVGNLIDRLFRGGEVVDFMNMGIGVGRWSLRTGIFNVADLAIMGGLGGLVLLELFTAAPSKDEAPKGKKP